MPGNEHTPQRDPHHVCAQARSAPLCYRRAKVMAAPHSHAEFDGGLLLSILTAVAAFWLAYRGWRL
jgi:hypothetical protein